MHSILINTISSNLNSVLKGRSQLWEKHFPQGMRDFEKRVCYNLFAKFLLNRGHKSTARHYFLEAWMIKPLILMPFFNFLITFLPINLVRYAFKLNKKIGR